MKVLNWADRLLFWEIIDSDGVYVKLQFPLKKALNFVGIHQFAECMFCYLFFEYLCP